MSTQNQYIDSPLDTTALYLYDFSNSYLQYSKTATPKDTKSGASCNLMHQWITIGLNDYGLHKNSESKVAKTTSSVLPLSNVFKSIETLEASIEQFDGDEQMVYIYAYLTQLNNLFNLKIEQSQFKAELGYSLPILSKVILESQHLTNLQRFVSGEYNDDLTSSVKGLLLEIENFNPKIRSVYCEYIKGFMASIETVSKSMSYSEQDQIEVDNLHETLPGFLRDFETVINSYVI
jgi:hypothetical protein